MASIKSFKGVEINMTALMEEQGSEKVVGNTNTNVRGDLIGRGGKILKTREQLEQEYYEKNPKAVEIVKKEGLNKDTIQDMLKFEKKIIEADLSKPAIVEDPAYKMELKHTVNPDIPISFEDTLTPEGRKLHGIDEDIEENFEGELPEPTKKSKKGDKN